MVKVQLGAGAWTPELILALLGLVLFTVDFVLPKRRWPVRLIALLAPLVSLALVPAFASHTKAFQGAIIIDG